jgi:methionine-rich copper-binding protein CopC
MTMKRLLIAGSLAAFAVVLLAGVVFGHSRPIRFDPAPGAVLSTAPAQVTGWFTSDLRRDPNWTFIKVSDTQGNQVETGVTVLSDDRRQMTASLRAGLTPGRYTVTWRTYDDGDGAIFGDCYTFFVGQEAANAAIVDKTRLDAGSACQRIDVEARDGTPVPGQTPTASGEGHDGSEEHVEGADGGGGVETWVLMLGVAGGFAVGLVGGRLIGGRS